MHGGYIRATGVACNPKVSALHWAIPLTNDEIHCATLLPTRPCRKKMFDCRVASSMQTKFFLYPPLTINVSSLFSRNWVRIWGTKSAKCNVSGTSIKTSFRVPAVNLSSTSSMLRKNAQVTKRGTFRGWSLSFLLWTMACFNRLDSFFRLNPDEGVFSRSLIEVSGDSVTSLEVSVETFSSSSSYRKVKMYVNRSMARLHSWTFLFDQVCLLFNFDIM